MNRRVRVIHTTVREVTIYRYKVEKGLNIKTDEVIRVDEITNTKQMFAGSEAAFKAWSAVHYIPPTAKIERFFSERKTYQVTELVYSNGKQMDRVPMGSY